MTLLILLAVVIPLASLAGKFGVRSLASWPAAVRVGLAAMFCLTGAAHFDGVRDLVRMVPPAIPNAEFMVTFTGVCEFLGALGLLLPYTRRAAAVALIVMLLALLPANIHAANTGLTLRGEPATPIVPRVAMQAALHRHALVVGRAEGDQFRHFAFNGGESSRIECVELSSSMATVRFVLNGLIRMNKRLALKLIVLVMVVVGLAFVYERMFVHRISAMNCLPRSQQTYLKELPKPRL